MILSQAVKTKAIKSDCVRDKFFSPMYIFMTSHAFSHNTIAPRFFVRLERIRLGPQYTRHLRYRNNNNNNNNPFICSSSQKGAIVFFSEKTPYICCSDNKYYIECLGYILQDVCSAASWLDGSHNRRHWRTSSNFSLSYSILTCTIDVITRKTFSKTSQLT